MSLQHVQVNVNDFHWMNHRITNVQMSKME